MNIVKISKGNMKVGSIPNMSLTPGVSCSREACKTCHVGGCYAMKSYRQYKNVRTAWDGNVEMALFDLETMETQLTAYFQKARPAFFRIHVGGDFITREYAEMWARVATAAPFTRFLAFTKQFDHVRGVAFPENFALVLSAWEGVTIPSDLADRLPIAYCVDSADDIPADGFHCPGSCTNCGACWELSKRGIDVYFVKH